MSATILDKIEAGLLTREQFELEVINQVYSGLHEYCQIPDGYRHCELGTRILDLDGLADEDLRSLLKNPPAEIINPYKSHIKGIEFFELLLSSDPLVCEQGNPLNPTIGAYLYGPPGSGKTHLMAAFGGRIKSILDDKLEYVREMMGDVIEKAFDIYIRRQASESESNDTSTGYLELAQDGTEEVTQSLSPADEFWSTINKFQARLKSYDYQPTDLIYIGFKELVELCKHSSERHDAMQALENARIVFIDDVHPQGDPEQIQIVLHLLERRYELGRHGTFLTTNLSAHELGGGDEMLGNRLLSRCAETLVKVVVTTNSLDEEIAEVCRRIAATAPDTPLVLQPVTPFGKVRETPDAGRLLSLVRQCRQQLETVRLVPQTHKVYDAL